MTSTRASATLRGVLGRGACGGGRLRSALRLIGGLLGGQPVGSQLRHALGIALRDGGHDARFARARLRGAGVALGERQFRFEIRVPQLEQQCAGLDVLAVGDRQARDLAAERRRQAGPATGVDGSCARVGDGRCDGAALGGDERHCKGLRPRDEPARRECNDNERRDDGDALHTPLSGGGIER